VKTRSLAEVAEAVGGRIRPAAAAAAVVGGVAIDSREVSAGDLFVALPGERTDGHAFVGAALATGAAAALVRADWARASAKDAGGPLIEVPDPARALLDLARDERARLRATVVGITGSTGKTTTKDLLASVLSRRFDVIASPASFNNEVGLPLTILRATERTRVVVCEMGSRGPGHIRLLCEVARPQIGVVTNVGVAHMELFGSARALVAAKAELPESLPAEGTAVLNADDAVVRAFAARTAARPVLFGSARDAEVRAEDVVLRRGTGAASFRLVTPAGSVPVELGASGEHFVTDALAAAAVGWVLEVPPEEIAVGLATAAVAGGRMEMLETPDGLRVINDAYNANPASVAAALKAARWMAGEGRCVAVLGHMAELGPIAGGEHERVGGLAAGLGVDALVIVGEDARRIAVGAEREGFEPERITVCDTIEDAVQAVRALSRPGDLVLVKASRVDRLERVVDALRSDVSRAAPASPEVIGA
jgi:UDP-N-acetylmuramoyl-tripeptide--D-alanyl-D-alanine ligase